MNRNFTIDMEILNEIVIDYSDYCHRKLIAEFGEYDTSCYDPIYWYQRFKHRVIDSRIREVFEASKLFIPNDYVSAYAKIKMNISNGLNLKKYQSRKLKKLDYDDDMLSHWGIHHLHLGSVVESDEFIQRTSDLLFIYLKGAKAFILGIFDHKSWCDVNVIEVIHNNWPSELSEFKSNKSSHRLTSEQYKALRSHGASSTIVVTDGTEYFSPGIGVTANGVAIWAKLNSDQVIYKFNEDFAYIKSNIQEILGHDPLKRVSEKLTIGMEMCAETKSFIYGIKETGFKFTLQNQ